MLFIAALLVGVAWLLSRVTVRKMVPFESLSAVMIAGLIMVSLLLTGRLT